MTLQLLARSRAAVHWGLAAALLASALLAHHAQAAVPSPTVIGPVPGKAPGDASRNYPWMATMHNLAAVGYVEEEFFIEGTANRYNTAVPLGTNGSVVSSGHTYRTRVIVRRPASPFKFNGTVLAEWQNVTAGYDLDAMWGASFEHIIRAGYAWVGVSAQRVGVQGTPNGLKNWSAARYDSLDVTVGNTIVDDSLSYDIFAQALQALRHPTGVRPLGKLDAKRVFAIGASQSASRLGVFINALHPLIGDPVDAYLLYIGGARVRSDLTVPIFKLISETDVPGQTAARQPDTPLYRFWEVAGTSHSGRRTVLNSRPLLARDGVAPSVGECARPPYPRVPIQYVTNAVFDHMVRWVREGVQPPSAPPVVVDGAVIQRDANGNALGGIRLAEFDVPTALNSGANTGSAFCVLYGSYVPFEKNVIDQLYPTQGSYIVPVFRQAHDTVRDGFILWQDSVRTKHLATHSIVGSGVPCSANCRAAQDLLEATWFYAYTSGQDDELAHKVITAIKAMTRGEASGGQLQVIVNKIARHALNEYVEDVQRLKAKGRLSQVAATELTTGANAVLAALP
ncbi:MAG: alpha/beta hydrolase domain-containing protein [Rhizobacter sp.]